jgi:glycosyltransferase involved in cell wall biosynthesis
MSSTAPHLLSVIVPCYHQGRHIVRILNHIDFTLKKSGYQYEIIAVVDGTNRDKTYESAKRIRSSKIRVYGYKNNKGKGYALRYGVVRSRGDVIAFIDAGTDLNPTGLQMLVAHFYWYNADIIVGSKWHPVSKVQYPLWRKILSKGYGMFVKFLFKLRIKDTQLGMKLFRRDVLENVLPRLLVKKYAFDIELLAVSHYLGYDRIYEAPVELSWDVVESTVSKHLSKTVAEMFLDTLAVYYRLKILKYYDSTSKRKWEYDPDLDFRVNVG